MVLAGLGAGLSGIVVVDFYDVALANGLPADEALRICDLAGSYGQGALIALPSILGLVVGINLAVFAAWRARAIPADPAGAERRRLGDLHRLLRRRAGCPRSALASAAIGLAWAGVVVLKMRDEVWDRI